jgi:hypothetical protein
MTRHSIVRAIAAALALALAAPPLPLARAIAQGTAEASATAPRWEVRITVPAILPATAITEARLRAEAEVNGIAESTTDGTRRHRAALSVVLELPAAISTRPLRAPLLVDAATGRLGGEYELKRDEAGAWMLAPKHAGTAAHIDLVLAGAEAVPPAAFALAARDLRRGTERPALSLSLEGTVQPARDLALGDGARAAPARWTSLPGDGGRIGALLVAVAPRATATLTLEPEGEGTIPDALFPVTVRLEGAGATHDVPVGVRGIAEIPPLEGRYLLTMRTSTGVPLRWRIAGSRDLAGERNEVTLARGTPLTLRLAMPRVRAVRLLDEATRSPLQNQAVRMDAWRSEERFRRAESPLGAGVAATTNDQGIVYFVTYDPADAAFFTLSMVSPGGEVLSTTAPEPGTSMDYSVPSAKRATPRRVRTLLVAVASDTNAPLPRATVRAAGLGADGADAIAATNARGVAELRFAADTIPDPLMLAVEADGHERREIMLGSPAVEDLLARGAAHPVALRRRGERLILSLHLVDGAGRGIAGDGATRVRVRIGDRTFDGEASGEYATVPVEKPRDESAPVEIVASREGFVDGRRTFASVAGLLAAMKAQRDLELPLRADTRGVLVLVNPAENWPRYIAARNAVAKELGTLLRDASHTTPTLTAGVGLIGGKAWTSVASEGDAKASATIANLSYAGAYDGLATPSAVIGTVAEQAAALASAGQWGVVLVVPHNAVAAAFASALPEEELAAFAERCAALGVRPLVIEDGGRSDAIAEAAARAGGAHVTTATEGELINSIAKAIRSAHTGGGM